MATNRDANGRFGAGNKASPGRPKLTETEIAARASSALIERRLPELIAHAMGRAETNDEVLAGVCHLLAERLRSQNLVAERLLLDGAKH
ncbi:hypothetical protein [Pseudomonas brassicacearum]|uniref:Uncharacterized protein n=1 Tax=Pseudomonas brassicacearum TaxID=930166 RepID=A0A423H1X5_9PSED|nr:hypothetical protein [Pseudomonas brassicacearum]RON06225.1 hypothetical protein BK658_00090 [Pseudomonas brassicacearum]